jgi:hypothetical protein
MSRGSHFHLDVWINKENDGYLVHRTQRLVPLKHRELHVRIFAPVFVDGAVNSNACISLLSNKFVPFLQGYATELNRAWFQDDGSKRRSRNFIPQFLHNVLEDTVLSNH